METETKPRHCPAFTIHTVPYGSGGLTAICGEQLDGENHTGRFGKPLILPGDQGQPCAACAKLATR